MLSRRYLLIIFLIGAVLLMNYGIARTGRLRSKPSLRESMIQSAVDQEETFPVFSGCRFGQEGMLAFKSRLLAHESIAKRDLLFEHPDVAVKEQLHYLIGYLNRRTPSSFQATIYPLAETHVSIIKKAWTSYGRNLKVDAALTNESMGKSTSEPEVKPSDRALEITYQARVAVLVCDTKRISPSLFPLALPLDPYFAFWFVPHSDRRPLHFADVTTVTNPCADAEMAQIQSPNSYWYAWNPYAKAHDADGRFFDCRTLLKPIGIDGRGDFIEAQARFIPKDEKSERLDFSNLAASESIGVRIVWGLISPTASRRSLENSLKLFNSGSDLIETARRVGQLDSGEKRRLNVDDAALTFLNFYRVLSDVAHLEHADIQDKIDFLTIHVRGELSRSKRPIDLEIYFGPTDQAQKTAKHWAFLKQAFAEAPMIFYVGHAGLGQNLSYRQMTTELGISKEELDRSVATLPYQFFGVVSCYGSAYFGEEYLAARRSIGHQTDLLVTAIEGDPFLTPATMLYYLDLKWSGRHVSLEKALNIGLKSDDAILVQRYSGDSM